MTRKRPIPGEFRYWANLDSRWARALRRGMQLALGFDPAPPEDVVETLATMYFDGDPLAEAFVEEVYLRRGSSTGRAMLERALAEGTGAMEDAPESLMRLFADIETDPDWVDQELVELGAKTFRRYGTTVFRFAGSITLTAYAENSVAKPLILTGAYAGGSTRHRFLETAAFWIAVSEPGGLAPGGSGRASALRVRIMHVFVRKRLLAHPEWDARAWGVPISQGDALLTLMGGSVAPGLGLKVMGFRPSAREIEAMMHFWRYVGHLMGVRPRWFPASLEDAARLTFVTLVKGAHRAGEDGRQLCSSYAKAFAPEPGEPLARRLRAAWEHRVHLGYTRLFVPPWDHRRNRLPRAGIWAAQPLMWFPLIFTAETLRRRFPQLGVDALLDRVARGARKRWLAYHMGDQRAEYRPAEQFTR